MAGRGARAHHSPSDWPCPRALPNQQRLRGRDFPPACSRRWLFAIGRPGAVARRQSRTAIGCRKWRLADDDWTETMEGRGLGGALGLFFPPFSIGRGGGRPEFPIGRRTLLLGRRGGVGGAPLADESALRLSQRGRPEPFARRPRPPRLSGAPARPEEPPSAAPRPLPAAPWPRDPSKCGLRRLPAA